MNQLKITKLELRERIRNTWVPPFDAQARVYGIPRGGWYIADLLSRLSVGIIQVDSPELANVFVDDIIDSGRTKEKFLNEYPGRVFWAPFDKSIEPNLPWIVFPWEGSAEKDGEELITRVLEHIGEDPKRPGLIDTPTRVVKSWKELYAGYKQNPDDLLKKVFQSDNDAMVICRDIEFYSTCEHHMIPFYGTASLGYIPNGQVLGLSKMARLVDIFARRLQIQEQLTRQIATSLMKIPSALGAAVVIKAKHLCMCGRGVAKQGSSMITSSMLGRFRDMPEVREEFLELIK